MRIIGTAKIVWWVEMSTSTLRDLLMTRTMMFGIESSPDMEKEGRDFRSIHFILFDEYHLDDSQLPLPLCLNL